jgi:hypothetical protein
MSKSELQSDRTNAGAAASRLKCAKKVLDIHRHFIDDLIATAVLFYTVNHESRFATANENDIVSARGADDKRSN